MPKPPELFSLSLLCYECILLHNSQEASAHSVPPLKKKQSEVCGEEGRKISQWAKPGFDLWNHMVPQYHQELRVAQS